MRQLKSKIYKLERRLTTGKHALIWVPSLSNPDRQAFEYWKNHPEYNESIKPLPFAYPGTDKPRLVDISTLSHLAERLRQSLERARGRGRGS